MTCSVPPLAGDVGAESHWQQGGWQSQQHAAARFFIRAAVFTSTRLNDSNLSSSQFFYIKRSRHCAGDKTVTPCSFSLEKCFIFPVTNISASPVMATSANGR